MTLEVETVVAVSLMMAVFSAVAAVGTSIVLGAGFERLRAGFDVISKQTGFFSEAIHKLEKKVEKVDEQTSSFSHSITQLEGKVTNVGDQANAFTESLKGLESKVEVVDKQTGFFSEAIQKLEKQVQTVDAHEKVVAEKMEKHAETDLISTGKAEALVAHAEDLLSQVSTLAIKLQDEKDQAYDQHAQQSQQLSIPRNLAHFVMESGTEEMEEIRYH